MYRIIFFFLFTNILRCPSLGQSLTINRERVEFFRGLYLKDVKILLPWEIEFAKIDKLNNPTITPVSNHKNQLLITWDSVKIVNDFLANVTILIRKSCFAKAKKCKIGSFNCSVDSITSQNLALYFTLHTGKPGYVHQTKKVKEKQWTIDGCRVFVGQRKFFGYFLIIQKLNI